MRLGPSNRPTALFTYLPTLNLELELVLDCVGAVPSSSLLPRSSNYSLRRGAQNAPSAATTVALPAEIPLSLCLKCRSSGRDRPLLIFEPRYREMVADALKGNRVIGMVMLQPGSRRTTKDGRRSVTSGALARSPNTSSCPMADTSSCSRPDDVSRPQRGSAQAVSPGEVQALPGMLKNEELGPEHGAGTPRATARRRASSRRGTAGPRLDDAEFVNVTAQNLRMPEADRRGSSAPARSRALARWCSDWRRAKRAQGQEAKVKG